MSKILYIDLDGVVCDFWGEIKEYISDIDSFVHEAQERMMMRVCESYNRHIFYDLEEIEGAKKSIDILKNHYDIYFLSTPMEDVAESYTDKRRWLTEHYGDWTNKRLILTHRKDLNKGSYIIDDRYVNGVEHFEGTVIQFGSKEFPNWEIVTSFLLDNR